MHNSTVVIYSIKGELVNIVLGTNYILTCRLQRKIAKQASTHKEDKWNALSGCKMQEPLGFSKRW